MSHCLGEADIPVGVVVQSGKCYERKNRGRSGVPGRSYNPDLRSQGKETSKLRPEHE